MGPMYREAGESILGVHAAIMDGRDRGEALVVPYRHLLDEAHAKFRQAVQEEDLALAADAWNELTEITARVSAGYAGIGVFLLASTMSGHDVTACDAIEQAVARGQE